VGKRCYNNAESECNDIVSNFNMKKNNLKETLQCEEGAHSLESQKAHTISEFIIVVENCGHMQLHLAFKLATVVSEWGRPNFNYPVFNSEGSH